MGAGFHDRRRARPASLAFAPPPAQRHLIHDAAINSSRLVAHLAELDTRRLYRAAGFSSLFTYCCEVLRLSEPAAYNRIEVARAARRFPIILPMLGEGSLSLATVRLLASHLTAENLPRLLDAAKGKSKRQVEVMLVGFFQKPDVPSSIRKLPAPVPPRGAVHRGHGATCGVAA